VLLAQLLLNCSYIDTAFTDMVNRAAKARWLVPLLV
jgi:hypothetical protein